MAQEDFFAETKRKYNQKKQKYDDREAAVEGYSDILSTLQDRLGSADTRAGMSVRDLYGDSIDRSADMVRSNANATKSALGRLGAARGGDVSGAQGATFNRVDEQANENVSNIIQYYTDRASTDREQAEARGDRLAQTMMGGQLNLANLAEQEIMRELQKRQAEKQRKFDIFGTLATAAGTVLGGPIGGAVANRATNAFDEDES